MSLRATLDTERQNNAQERFDRLCQSRLVYLAVGLLTLFWILFFFAGRLPTPTIHDEFSFLFGAETFLHGHLTNPTHPFWRHFESFHVLSQPTWMTKYQPAQTLALAAAKAVFGQPIVGVWFSTIAGALAVQWTLRAYVSPRLAFLGGLVFAADPVGPYSWSYHLGYVAAGVPLLGGALVTGGVRRLCGDTPHRRDALLLGIGLTLLALSRPFEGTLIAVGGLTALGIRFTQEHRWKRRGTAVLATLFLLPLVIGCTFQLIYNRAVTGSPFRMPYAVHFQQYDVAPLFIVMKPPAHPQYDNDVFPVFYAQYEKEAIEKRTLRGFLFHLLGQMGAILFLPNINIRLLALCSGLYFVGLFWLLLRGDWWQRAAAASLLFFALILCMAMYASMHYVAPATALSCVVLLQFLSSLASLRQRNPALFVTATIVLSLVTMMALQHKWAVFQGWRQSNPPPAPTFAEMSWSEQRAAIESVVAHSSNGRQVLIFVDYMPGHSPHQDWIANHSPVDTAPVVWARLRTPDENDALMRYYPNREVWRLTVGPPPGEEYPRVLFPRQNELIWRDPRTAEKVSPWFIEKSNERR